MSFPFSPIFLARIGAADQMAGGSITNDSAHSAHLVMQILAWMWSIIFSLGVGSYLAFGITAVAHSLVLAGVFVTLALFQVARRHAPQG